MICDTWYTFISCNSNIFVSLILFCHGFENIIELNIHEYNVFYGELFMKRLSTLFEHLSRLIHTYFYNSLSHNEQYKTMKKQPYNILFGSTLQNEFLFLRSANMIRIKHVRNIHQSYVMQYEDHSFEI